MLDFLPFFRSPAGDRSIHHIRELYADSEESLALIGAIGSSSLYFWWFFALGNCRNLTREDVVNFPAPKLDVDSLVEVRNLFQSLMNSFRLNSVIKKRAASEYQEFDWVKSKPDVDRIDKFLAKVFCLTEEQSDFLINFDIKIRAGANEEHSDD
jgi:hypothetical protein